MATIEYIEKPAKPRKPPRMKGFVGISNLPKQIHRKSVKKGFRFTIMVVGESGLGKSTLLNSLFLSDLYVNYGYIQRYSMIDKTLQINESTFDLQEGDVKLKLTIIDTPGFGDNIDNTNSWNIIVHSIDQKHEAYLNAESRVHRTKLEDNRVHCCLYFIAPTGHGLKQLDIEFMQRLHTKVNIIPVIAKADTLTAEECANFKDTILRETEENQTNVYNFPPLTDDGRDEKEYDFIRRLPFAVVGSNTTMEVAGKKIRGRKYPWGIVDVENLEHCDFVALRNLLLGTHMQDLIEMTNDIHYENYRSERLQLVTEGMTTLASQNSNPMEQIEKERDNREERIRAMEMEMEQVFTVKVKEKEKKLLTAEKETTHKYQETMQSLAKTRKMVEEGRKKLGEERGQIAALLAEHWKNEKIPRKGSNR